MPYAFYFLALILTVVHHQSPANESPAARADHVALCRVLVSSHRPSSDGTFDLTIVRNRQGLDAAYLNVVADFNGDGFLDLAIANWSEGSIGLLLVIRA